MEEGILVGIPAYGGQVSHGSLISVIRLERACRARGIPIDYEVIANESLITRARNYLASVFLRSGRSHLLFIDADIQFEPEDILRMYDLGLPLIGGLYPKKNLLGPDATLSGHFAMTPLQGMQGKTLADPAEPLPVLHIGTGIMLVQRTVFDQLAPWVPTYTISGTEYRAFFDTSITPEGAYLSEDYHFCALWRRAGGTVHAAPWCRVTHWGTHGFSGTTNKI